jgi:hypothetical protein
MTTHTYVPVVKGKANDLKAVSRIRETSMPGVKPLVEIVPLPSTLSMDLHLDKFSHHLSKYMSNRDVFVDFYGFKPGAKLLSGIDATIGGFRLLKAKGLRITPTYGFDRDDALWTPLRTEVHKNGNGFCFRVDIDDLDDRSEETWEGILERSAELGLAPGEVDIFIDLRYIGEKPAEFLKNLVLDFLAYMPGDSKYRSVVVSGSSALKHVGSIEKNGVGEIERNELRLWMQLQADLHGHHKIVYSDYGVVHPEFSMVGPNKNANAKIRYTTSGKIKVYRGHSLAEVPGYKQYHFLAKQVRNAPDYMKREFSDGDRYIDDCADWAVTSGNLGTWVYVDMNHHFQQTALQVQELSVTIDERFSEDEIEEVMELA